MAGRPAATARRLFFPASNTQLRAYSAPAERAIPPNKQKYVPTEGTYPKGFVAGTSHAGVKASNTKYDDITLVASETPCTAAAVFTRNIFKAAPVQVSKVFLQDRQQKLADSRGFRGIVVNSGCANAVTGRGGIEDATEMAYVADKLLADGESSDTVTPSTLVMSTGVIGQRLPMAKITAAIPKAHAALGNTHEHWLNAAKAICTTDTFPKLISRTFSLPSHPGTEYRIAGMTKGAGMIAPNMGTLLGIICTDATVASFPLRRAMRSASEKTFNCISIDGDTSTNDTVAIFANGAASPVPTRPIRDNETSGDYEAFEEVLTDFMTDLAKLVVRDGEGATKFVTIRVRSDNCPQTAKRAASSIAKSSLVKTALYGKDANWGRILCAIGYAPLISSSFEADLRDIPMAAPDQVIPERTSVSFIPSDGSAELKLLVRGEPEQVDEARAKEILEMEDLEILVRLEDGSVQSDRKVSECVYYTCDFSHEYVTINGDYRT